ncbi:MAG: peptidylprolyl isomerase [Polyangiaceae bacterium]
MPQEVLPDTTDPEAGDFTMDEALVGMPEGPGPLRATFVLQFGNIVCELLPDVAPIGVANFVGLGRGARPWRDPATKQWVKRPFYDGLVFHRIIDDFMAQGGDPLGTGAGGPGYKLTNASSDIGAEVSVPGTLAYANSGSPGSSGSQFYITEVATPWLDGDYIIFGHCTPLAVIDGLTSVPVEADGETPVDPPVIQYVTFTRCAPDAQ